MCAMESLPVIDAPIFVTVYEYGIGGVKGRYSQLWVADNGLVLYAGVRGHTGWQGAFHLYESSFHMARLNFWVSGIDLYRWACGWFGVDNAGRHIRLTQLYRLQYDYANEVWVPANDGTM